jgi:chromosomal replication initiation ATPase DnaA
LGGWRVAKRLKEGSLRLKGDERILGDSDFVLEVLKASEEELERKYRLRAEGFTLERLAARVAGVFGLGTKDLWSIGKYAKNVRARSVFCYWAVRELGWSATEIARRLRITQPAVSISVKRGEQIAKEMELKMPQFQV